jgi:AcrR family transcriptional regulator
MSQSVNTREKLLEAGKRVIYRKGFHSARVSDITEEAGVAHGTFYLYFKAKEDFLLELLRSVRDRILELNREGVVLIREGNRDKGRELVFLESFKLMIEERELAKILFFEAMCTSRRFQDFYSESKKLLIESTCEALRLLSVQNPELKSEILVGTARHLIEDLILTNREVFDQWQRVLVELGV